VPPQQRMQDMIAEALRTLGNLEELAAEIGVSYPTLWLWSKGKRTPRPANVQKLADALRRRGVDLVALADELEGAAGG
jgi:transcriptional regulator with XRE-family HTH domain